MEGLGAAIILLTVGGIVVAVVAVIEAVVFLRLVLKDGLRPGSRAWLLFGGSLIAAALIGMAAHVRPAAGSIVMPLIAAIGIATFILLLLVAQRSSRGTFVAYGVGVALELGLFLGLAIFPRTPLVGGALDQIRCDADLYCDDASAAVDTTALVTLHLAGIDAWLLDASGSALCHLDPRPGTAVSLSISGEIPVDDDGVVRLQLVVTPDGVALDMDRAGAYTDIYVIGRTLVINGEGPLAAAQGELRIDGVELARGIQQLPDERPDITGTLEWTCDAG